MVRDKQTEVMEESIRRLMEQSAEMIDDGEVELRTNCPIQMFVDPEQIKRLAALNIAMARIIESVSWN